MLEAYPGVKVNDQMGPCERCNIKDHGIAFEGRDVWKHRVRLNMVRQGHLVTFDT